MAASTVIRSEVTLDTNAVVAASAARTAPRGPGLATVVALPIRGGASTTRTPGTDRPEAFVVAPNERVLRVVPAPVRRPRRATATAAGLVAALALVLGGVGGTLMNAQPDPVVAGHVVLQPGETLWDIAVRSAPAGVDARQQLDILRRINGFGPGALDAWTVVLIPAR